MPSVDKAIGPLYFCQYFLHFSMLSNLSMKSIRLVPLNNFTEPIAWTRFADNSRIFYTSLGYPDDFKLPQFRRLLINAIYWALDMNEPE